MGAKPKRARVRTVIDETGLSGDELKKIIKEKKEEK